MIDPTTTDLYKSIYQELQSKYKCFAIYQGYALVVDKDEDSFGMVKAIGIPDVVADAQELSKGLPDNKALSAYIGKAPITAAMINESRLFDYLLDVECLEQPTPYNEGFLRGSIPDVVIITTASKGPRAVLVMQTDGKHFHADTYVEYDLATKLPCKRAGKGLPVFTEVGSFT